METPIRSTAEIPQPDASALRAGLIAGGHKSLRAWAAKRRINYNTAWAALHGRRAGKVTLRVLRQLRKDARAA